MELLITHLPLDCRGPWWAPLGGAHVACIDEAHTCTDEDRMWGVLLWVVNGPRFGGLCLGLLRLGLVSIIQGLNSNQSQDLDLRSVGPQ